MACRQTGFAMLASNSVQQVMDRFAKLTGRQYKLFDYAGAPDAEHVIVIMGSGAEAVGEVVDALVAKGAKIGVLKVRLYRPFDARAFVGAIPKSAKIVTVLDRTKEPGSIGEPLYTDVCTAFYEAAQSCCSCKPPTILGGRYGLGSKEFTPAMVKAVFDNMAAAKPKNHFTVGINDDVTNTSLEIPAFQIEAANVRECLFYGLASDGTVGANKNSIKVIGEDTENFAQGYFVYDSKKAGTVTVSHLRFGPKSIHSTYLCTKADFIACHNFTFLEKVDMLKAAKPGATFLLTSPYAPSEVWQHIPDEVAQTIIDKKLSLYVVDAAKLAAELGLGGRINTIMQTCFFYLSGILPQAEAVESLKKAAKKAYGKKGDAVVKSNWDAIDAAVASLNKIEVPAKPAGKIKRPPVVPAHAPAFVQNVTAKIMAQQGDTLPVSAMVNMNSPVFVALRAGVNFPKIKKISFSRGKVVYFATTTRRSVSAKGASHEEITHGLAARNPPRHHGRRAVPLGLVHG